MYHKISIINIQIKRSIMETRTNEKFWNEMQEIITVLFKNSCTCLMLYNIHEVQETNDLLSYENKALNVLP